MEREAILYQYYERRTDSREIVHLFAWLFLRLDQVLYHGDFFEEDVAVEVVRSIEAHNVKSESYGI